MYICMYIHQACLQARKTSHMTCIYVCIYIQILYLGFGVIEQHVYVSTMFGTHPRGARPFAKCVFLCCAELKTWWRIHICNYIYELTHMCNATSRCPDVYLCTWYACTCIYLFDLCIHVSVHLRAHVFISADWHSFVYIHVCVCSWGARHDSAVQRHRCSCHWWCSVWCSSCCLLPLQHGVTALMLASSYGHFKTAAKLIAAGAKFDVQDKVREGGRAGSSCCSSMCVCLCCVCLCVHVCVWGLALYTFSSYHTVSVCACTFVYIDFPHVVCIFTVSVICTTFKLDWIDRNFHVWNMSDPVSLIFVRTLTFPWCSCSIWVFEFHKCLHVYIWRKPSTSLHVPALVDIVACLYEVHANIFVFWTICTHQCVWRRSWPAEQGTQNQPSFSSLAPSLAFAISPRVCVCCVFFFVSVSHLYLGLAMFVQHVYVSTMFGT